MVRVVFDLEHERDTVLVLASQALVAFVLPIEDGAQLAQVAP
jgi:hypothetical protein